VEQKAAHLRERGEAQFEEAERFEWAARADHVEILDRGYAFLFEAEEKVEQPAGLLVVLDRMISEDPRAAVGVLFAAILDRIEGALSDGPPRPAVAELMGRYEAFIRAETRRPREQAEGES
jgi:hypothetical protein